jgi:hypothetical protein
MQNGHAGDKHHQQVQYQCHHPVGLELVHEQQEYRAQESYNERIDAIVHKTPAVWDYRASYVVLEAVACLRAALNLSNG